MNNNSQLSVREIEKKDFVLIADYWLDSDAEFLIFMGVDLNKLPKREDLLKMLTEQIKLSYDEKKSFALIWEFEGKPIGHSNVNDIEYGNKAKMHLHLWNSNYRKKGMGTELVKKSIPFYFEKLELKKLICEPYAFNPAPNKTLEKVGFKLEKKYLAIPGYLNFEQEVNRWIMTIEKYLKTLHYKKHSAYRE